MRIAFVSASSQATPRNRSCAFSVHANMHLDLVSLIGDLVPVRVLTLLSRRQNGQWLGSRVLLREEPIKHPCVTLLSHIWLLLAY